MNMGGQASAQREAKKEEKLLKQQEQQKNMEIQNQRLKARRAQVSTGMAVPQPDKLG